MGEYINETEVLQRALDTYGSALQIVVMMEEMSELQKELCKYLRGKYSPASIAEEIADVEIMLEQMKMLFCCADDVHDVRRKKVERLKERLMTEYIERDMLCRVLERYRKAPKNRYQRGVEDGMELALNAVKAIHTADVAPVVHCKDCAHRTEMGNCGHPRHHGILPSAYPYDFCSYGERNEVT